MNKKYTIFFVAISVLFLILSGCSSTKPVTTQDPDWKQATQQTEAPPVSVAVPVEAPETLKEAPFDPVEFADDGLLVPRQRSVSRPPADTVEPEDILVEADSVEVDGQYEEQERQGYRVQIFSTSDNDGAREVEQTASMQFSESVYVTYDPPYYKVRVGDCLEREAADSIRQKAVSIGYRDAWVVRDKVIVKVKTN